MCFSEWHQIKKIQLNGIHWRCKTLTYSKNRQSWFVAWTKDDWNVSSCLIFSPRCFLYEPGGQHAPDRPHMWICPPGAPLMTSICVTTIVSKLLKCDVNMELHFNVCALFKHLSALFEESCACNPRLLSRLSSLIETLSMFPSDLSDYLSLHALLQNN